jgi:hypothetical protein
VPPKNPVMNREESIDAIDPLEAFSECLKEDRGMAKSWLAAKTGCLGKRRKFSGNRVRADGCQSSDWPKALCTAGASWSIVKGFFTTISSANLPLSHVWST